MTDKKTILITGATDGIGLEAAKLLAGEGHDLLLHGRSQTKLDAAIAAVGEGGQGFLADLSELDQVRQLARDVAAATDRIDVLINNAGVLKTPTPLNSSGQDVRFLVNTVAPYLLTRQLEERLSKSSRVVNLASAAQAPVDLAALRGEVRLSDDFAAYSQSKLAIMMWTSALAAAWHDGPLVVSVNPGSLLASKMVREGFGMAGKDIMIGANILREAALGDSFLGHSGAYFDNDSGRFAPGHPAGEDAAAQADLMRTLDELIGADALIAGDA